MAHFAQLDENNKVTNVIVINNSEILDEHGKESEEKGIQLCKKLFGENTIWVQTSYNARFRKNYAGIDHVYDSERDAFIPFKLHESWTLNEITCRWKPPVPHPNDGKPYYWNEDIVQWELDRAFLKYMEDNKLPPLPPIEF